MIPRSLGDVTSLLNSSVIQIASNWDVVNSKMFPMLVRLKEALSLVVLKYAVNPGIDMGLG
jgi:hypothetical protein